MSLRTETFANHISVCDYEKPINGLHDLFRWLQIYGHVGVHSHHPWCSPCGQPSAVQKYAPAFLSFLSLRGPHQPTRACRLGALLNRFMRRDITSTPAHPMPGFYFLHSPDSQKYCPAIRKFHLFFNAGIGHS